MFTPTLVAVFGATGAQGAPVVEALLEQGTGVRGLARNRDAIVARFGTRIQARSAELDGDLTAALDGCDAVFFHLPIAFDPRVNGDRLTRVLAASRSVGIGRFVFSTSGATLDALPAIPFVEANRLAASRVLESGLPAVVLRPTVYLENLLWPNVVEGIKTHGVLDYPPLSPTRRLSWTALADQAGFAVRALTSEAAVGGVFDIASGGALTGDELAAVLARKVGRPVRYAPLTPDAFGAGLGEAFGNPAVGAAIASLYQAIDGLAADGAVVDLGAAQTALGYRPITVTEWIDRVFPA